MLPLFFSFQRRASLLHSFLTTSSPSMKQGWATRCRPFDQFDTCYCSLKFTSDSVSDFRIGDCLLSCPSSPSVIVSPFFNLSLSISFALFPAFPDEHAKTKAKAYLYFPQLNFFTLSLCQFPHSPPTTHLQPSPIPLFFHLTSIPYILKHKNLVFLPNPSPLACVSTQGTQ